MAEQTTERITVGAPPERCYEVAVDFELYPEWAKDIKDVKVVERDAEGRGRHVEYRAAAMGRSVTYTLEYDYAQAPAGFSWTLVKGDLMKRLDGTYRFDADGDGTRVTYELSVDLALPLPGLVKRRAESRIVGSALKELKKRVESGQPSTPS
ncbi:MAG: SRPBCC family protein [Actinobacteria bacterium]|nr:SRPBCC family protein [Actinomycetota bacterium]